MSCEGLPQLAGNLELADGILNGFARLIEDMIGVNNMVIGARNDAGIQNREVELVEDGGGVSEDKVLLP